MCDDDVRDRVDCQPEAQGRQGQNRDKGAFRDAEESPPRAPFRFRRRHTGRNRKKARYLLRATGFFLHDKTDGTKRFDNR